jgi:cytochrome P450
MSLAQPRDLNPVSPENLLDPQPLYRALRETAPVHWSEEVHAWIITRHDDVSACFRDSRFSANRVKFFEAQAGALGPEILKDYLGLSRGQMLMKDGAEHIRLRRATMAAFTPLALSDWRPVIYSTMERLVNQVQDRGQMDLVQEISYQLPPLVISEMLGIPAEERSRFQEWSTPLADFTGPGLDVDIVDLARRANKAAKEMYEYLLHHIERLERLNDLSGRDVLSQMLHTQQPGGQISKEELANIAMLFLTAGHMTTTDQLSNGIYGLLTHPDQLQLLRDDPTLLPSAVEEILRYSPAVPFFHRIAAVDIQLRGKTIRQGDVVFLGMAAANRDPEAFSDPDRFDITRSYLHSRHLTFGHGPHHCLGAGLARRELEIAFEVLLRRLPGLRLDEQQEPQLKYHSLVFRGFNVLPVRW